MNQTKMTEEEMAKATEEYKKSLETFLTNMKDNPTDPVTNADLSKAIDFIFNEVGGIAQMNEALAHNMTVLNNNFNMIMQAIQGGGQGPAVKQTKSGIILP